MDQIDDMATIAFKIRTEKDPESQAAHLKSFKNEYYPMYCRALDKRLALNESKVFLAGPSMSIADFAFAGRYFNFVKNEKSFFYPHLEEVHNKHEHLKWYTDHLDEVF